MDCCKYQVMVNKNIMMKTASPIVVIHLADISLATKLIRIYDINIIPCTVLKHLKWSPATIWLWLCEFGSIQGNTIIPFPDIVLYFPTTDSHNFITRQPLCKSNSRWWRWRRCRRWWWGRRWWRRWWWWWEVYLMNLSIKCATCPYFPKSTFLGI